MKLKKLRLSEIKPYWRNPRRNEKGVEVVKKSIKDYGYNVPIIVDKNNVIVAGHTRYKALQELGYEEVECIVLDLPPNKIKEYRIADNKTAEFGEWDYMNLIAELREIDKLDEFQLYFPDMDLEKVVKEIDNSLEELSEEDEEDIDEAEKRLENSYAEKVGEYFGKQIELTCPHCGKSYYVRVDELIDSIKGYDVDLEGLKEKHKTR